MESVWVLVLFFNLGSNGVTSQQVGPYPTKDACLTEGAAARKDFVPIRTPWGEIRLELMHFACFKKPK